MNTGQFPIAEGTQNPVTRKRAGSIPAPGTSTYPRSGNQCRNDRSILRTPAECRALQGYPWSIVESQRVDLTIPPCRWSALSGLLNMITGNLLADPPRHELGTTRPPPFSRGKPQENRSTFLRRWPVGPSLLAASYRLCCHEILSQRSISSAWAHSPARSRCQVDRFFGFVTAFAVHVDRTK